MASPTDLVHARAENTVTITWQDGVVAAYPAPYLRRWCPCATCQGHGRGVRMQPASDGVEIQSIHEMGAYAVVIRFSDGHDTGIYTWDWLRSLAPQTPPTGYKTGAFLDGKFVP